MEALRKSAITDSCRSCGLQVSARVPQQRASLAGFSQRRKLHDGILWVNLGAQRPEIMLATIPALLGRNPVEKVEQLADFIRDLDLLLILDNLESVLEDEVREATRSLRNKLLRNTSSVRMIATTRQLVGGIELGETPVSAHPLDNESALNLLVHRRSTAKSVHLSAWPIPSRPEVTLKRKGAKLHQPWSFTQRREQYMSRSQMTLVCPTYSRN
jgi:hypothetical protein